MDAEVKRKWVDALRSGDYEQGMNRLRRGNRYCCLGVLCSVAIPGEWRRDHSRTEGDDVFIFRTPDGDVEYSISDNSGILTGIGLTEPQEADLITMNDKQDADFNKIADYIEEHY
jgi:hypothetical protein